MDFSPYKALLDRIVPLSYQQDAETLLNSLLPETDSRTHYRLLAEINRLKAPCLRVLDLRQLFPQQCRPVLHQGLYHMLPPRLEQRFGQLLEQYNGDYTRGLYEALLTELETLRQQPAMLNSTPWHRLGFGIRRQEPRLQFVTPVRFHLADGELQTNSLDISVHGLMATLASAAKLPEEVEVSFPGLARQPALACLAEPRHYRRVCQGKNEKGRVRLQRIEPDKAWDQALEQFIDQNQGRYGQDAEDLFETALSQCWGRALLESGQGQVLFFDARGSLQQALCNRAGKPLLEYWQQKEQGDLLGCLLAPERILAMAGRSQASMLLYAFRVQGKTASYRFAAEHDRLEQDRQLAQFISEGQRAGTLQLYHLSLSPVRLSDALLDDLDVMGQTKLKMLKWQLWLTPLPAPEPEQRLPARPRLLQPYLLPATPAPLNLVPLRQAALRKETRFRFNTPVELALGDALIRGGTEDISVQGMKVRLEKALELELLTEVQLSLPELSKLGRDWKLKRLRYRVINQSGDGHVLHLQAEPAGKNHAGCRFFTALLAQNQDKLRARPETMQHPAWIRLLTRQAVQQLAGPAFILGRNDGGFYVQGSLAADHLPALMGWLGNDDDEASPGRLLSRPLLQSVATILQRPSGRSHLLSEVWLSTDAAGVRQRQIDPDAATRERLLASDKELTVCQLISNRLQLRQLDLYMPEWQRLTETSLYKTQQLEQNLAELSLLCQVIDITGLARSSLNAPAAGPAPLPG
ncbi:PilZ domain-containing protein [Oceanimonas sp. MB9]|uniref:PilZ domain-containing protein n=1 Tax=Oceanimonas sp. MB9 TaxID=2588453 RepID=UPI0013F64FE3|nr:PilZ domain-containing protein [Oceanimonas sp. MB9]NHH99622.1 hypothetical protein [Oceanimonas sp. MB9]